MARSAGIVIERFKDGAGIGGISRPKNSKILMKVFISERPVCLVHKITCNGRNVDERFDLISGFPSFVVIRCTEDFFPNFEFEFEEVKNVD